MYKVLIADDDRLIREGLLRTIPWEELQCQIAGLAQNGWEAIELLDRMQPHILITDIKMPGKSGLEVIQYAAERYPAVQAILLSGYNDFEYARKAVELRALNYILKPTVYEDVVNNVKRAVAMIREEEQKQQELAQFRSVFKNRLHLYKTMFLKQLLVQAAVDEHQIRDSIDFYHLPQKPYVLLLLKIEKFASLRQTLPEEDRHILLMAFEHRVNAFLAQSGRDPLIPLAEDVYGILLFHDDPLSEGEICEFCENLQTATREHYSGMRISIGVSRAKQTLSMLHRAYIEAGEALRHMLYLGSEAIVFYDGLKPMNAAAADAHLFYSEKTQELLKLLKIGNEPECVDCLHYLFQLFQYHQEHPDTVRAVCLELSAQISAAAVEIGVETDRHAGESIYAQLMQCETIDGYYELLQQTVSRIAGAIYRKTRTNHKKVVEQIMKMIEADYARDISLNSVARSIYMNSSYLSRLIKNECGETFSQLLNRYRLEKAKEWLKDPTVKIYEVSEKVGFSDAQYFAVRFKKYTGMSPSEYRDHYIPKWREKYANKVIGVR